MTQEEFEALEVGDTVYYYNNYNIVRPSQINASLKKKKVGKILIRDDGEKRVAFQGSGVILMSFLYMFDTDKDKLLYKKLIDIKKKMKEVKCLNNPNCTHKFLQVLNQKNVKPMLEQYPELLI